MGSEQRVDEGGDGGAFSQDDQAAQEHENDDDRKEPEFLPLFHEGPELEHEFSHGCVSSVFRTAASYATTLL